MPAVSVDCRNMYYPETELSTRCCPLVTKKYGTGKGPIASANELVIDSWTSAYCVVIGATQSSLTGKIGGFVVMYSI